MDTPNLMVRRFMLALCVWREARGEPYPGKLMVAQVIKNRVEDKRWPDDYVGVITQPYQFSAFNQNDPNVVKFPKEDDPAWKESVAAADAVLAAREGHSYTSANHYHVKQMDPKPRWAEGKTPVGEAGNHVFYCL